MMRACVFMLGAPLAAAVMAGVWFGVWFLLLGDDPSARGYSVVFALAFGTASFAFTLPVSAITGSIDGLLSRVLPVVLRAPVIAMAGATIAYVLAAFLVSRHPPALYLATYAAIGGGAIMGASSLLSEHVRR